MQRKGVYCRLLHQCRRSEQSFVCIHYQFRLHTANVTRQRRPGTSKRFCQSDMFANEVHSTASLFICRQLTRHNRGSLYPPNRRHSPSDWHRCRILGWHFGHAHVYSLAHFDILDRCAPLTCAQSVLTIFGNFCKSAFIWQKKKSNSSPFT